MNRKYIFGLIVVFGSLGVGILIGKTLFPNRKKNIQFTSTLNSNHVHWINPLVEAANENHLSYQPIKKFDRKVQEVLEAYNAKYPRMSVSFIFKDLNTLSETLVNGKTLYAPASLMKIPVMVAVLKLAESKPSILKERIQYITSKYNLEEESGFAKVDGQFYSVEDLMTQSIAYSDNNATYMLRLFVGEKKISETEDVLGAHISEGSTYKDDILSIQNIANMFTALYESSYLSPEMSDKALGILSESIYHNGIRKVIPSSIIVAQKYGVRFKNDKNRRVVQNQLHQFGIVYFSGKPFLIGIMSKAADQHVLEEIIENLTKVCFTEIQSQLKNYKSSDPTKHYPTKIIVQTSHL